MKSNYLNKLRRYIKDEFRFTIESGDCHCLKCGTSIDSTQYICDNCMKEIISCEYSNCLMCGRLSQKILCEYCMEFRKPFVKINYCFPYESFAGEAFVSYKEHGNMLYGNFLTHAMVDMFPSFNIPDVDYITNVPAHFIRPILRLCDPPKRFALSISKVYDIEYRSCLTRISNKHAHRKSSREVRMRTAEQNFHGKDIDLQGKNVLLVDDVITTGATTHVCTNELKKMGASKVYVLSLCCVASR